MLQVQSYNLRVLLLVMVSVILSQGVSLQSRADDLDESVPEATVQVEPDHLDISIGSNTYRVDDPQAGDPDRALFDSMGEQDQQLFQRNRRIFLPLVARGLSLMKYGFGMGSIVKEKISFQLQKLNEQHQYEDIQRMSSPGAQEDFLMAKDRDQAEQEEQLQTAVKLTLKERSQQVLLSFLKGIDRKLWQQSALFARSNEFGLLAAGGFQLIVGKSDKGLGGSFDLGISIGYNRDTRSLAIQFYSEIERYKSTVMPAIFMTGALGKAGIYIANQRAGELVHNGISYYPPMAPAYSSATQDNAMSGFSSGGPFSWPPSPIGDMLTYTNQLNQSVLLRITISPMTKGFIRVQTGLGVGLAKTVAMSVKDAISGIFGGSSATSGNRCSMILSP